MNRYWISLLLFIVPLWSDAQTLKPGFDKEEYRQLMLLNTRSTAAPSYYKDFTEPADFRMIYQSPVMGMDNLWDLWVDGKGAAAISIRGTTGKAESWLANFYAAMVPAKGELKVSPGFVFWYKLAQDDKAAVHVGWLLSLAYLSKDMLPKIDSCYKSGIRDFLLMGHSQGGAINFLLTAYLRQLQKDHKLPADMHFKTYCSAGPKPGNLYFAYEYEAMTQGGWAYNVVNSADWVPETPMSIQTLHDFNNTNPFVNAKAVIRKQKFPNNIALKYAFNRLDKPSRRAQRNYQKYLGTMVSKMVRKNLKGYTVPVYYGSNNYARTGNTIVLLADADYYSKFPDDKVNMFVHHFHKPYLYLLDKLRLQ